MKISSAAPVIKTTDLLLPYFERCLTTLVKALFTISPQYRLVLSARAPECQKLRTDGLDQYGKVQKR